MVDRSLIDKAIEGALGGVPWSSWVTDTGLGLKMIEELPGRIASAVRQQPTVQLTRGEFSESSELIASRVASSLSPLAERMGGNEHALERTQNLVGNLVERFEARDARLSRAFSQINEDLVDLRTFLGELLATSVREIIGLRKDLRALGIFHLRAMQQLADELAHQTEILENPHATEMTELRDAGINLMRKGAYGYAEETLDRAVSAFPDDGCTHYARAICRIHSGDVPGARESFRDAIQIEENDDAAAVYCQDAAQLEHALGELLAEAALLGDAVQKAPNDIALRYEYALALAQTNQLESAGQQLCYALVFDPPCLEQAQREPAFDALRADADRLIGEPLLRVQLPALDNLFVPHRIASAFGATRSAERALRRLRQTGDATTLSRDPHWGYLRSLPRSPATDELYETIARNAQADASWMISWLEYLLPLVGDDPCFRRLCETLVQRVDVTVLSYDPHWSYLRSLPRSPVMDWLFEVIAWYSQADLCWMIGWLGCVIPYVGDTHCCRVAETLVQRIDRTSRERALRLNELQQLFTLPPFPATDALLERIAREGAAPPGKHRARHPGYWWESEGLPHDQADDTQRELVLLSYAMDASRQHPASTARNERFIALFVERVGRTLDASGYTPYWISRIAGITPSPAADALLERLARESYIPDASDVLERALRILQTPGEEALVTRNRRIAGILIGRLAPPHFRWWLGEAEGAWRSLLAFPPFPEADALLATIVDCGLMRDRASAVRAARDLLGDAPSGRPLSLRLTFAEQILTRCSRLARGSNENERVYQETIALLAQKRGERATE